MKMLSSIKIVAFMLCAGLCLAAPVTAETFFNVDSSSISPAAEDRPEVVISLNPEGIELKNYTLPKATIQIKPHYTNRGTQDLTYSGNFTINQKVNNVWKPVDSVSDSKESFSIPAGQSSTETLTLKSQLAPGDYRFIKQIGKNQYTIDFKVSSVDTKTKVDVTLNRSSFPEGTEKLTLSMTNNTSTNSGYGFEHKLEKREEEYWYNVTGNRFYQDLYAILPCGESSDTWINLDTPLTIGSYRLIKTVGKDSFVIPFKVTPKGDYPYLLNINVEKDSYPVNTDKINLIIDNATEESFNLSREYKFQQKINNKWVNYSKNKSLDLVLDQIFYTGSYEDRVLGWKTGTIAVYLPDKMPTGEYRMILSQEGQNVYLPITIK